MSKSCRTESRAESWPSAARALRALRSEGDLSRGSPSAASPPCEHGLLQVIDPLTDAATERDLPELVQDRSGRRVDEVIAERHLNYGAVALGDRDETRLAFQQCL